MSVLSTTARKEYYMELADALPPPVIDKLEYRERRLIAAVETFDALRPGDAYEGRLAVRIVLCGAHAAESLREASLYRDDFAKATRCRAQAASMMRAECSAKRTLERERKMRLAGEAVAGSEPGRPAVAAGLPQQAELQPAPPWVKVAAEAPPSILEQPAVAPPRLAAANPAPPPSPSGSVPLPSPEAIAKAEAFVNAHAPVAAQIRHDRGVTPRNQAHFRQVAFPTDPAVIDALVRGASGLLTLLDDAGCEALAEAA